MEIPRIESKGLQSKSVRCPHRNTSWDPAGDRTRFVTYKRRSPYTEGMDLRVIENEDQELSIEIGGEDHTFMNVLKGTLLETDGVAAATYDMNPEQSGGQTEPILTIKTEDGIAPLDALETAAGKVKEKTTEFRDAFEAAA